MKKIEAIIRKTKFEDVKEALLQSDIDWFEYHNVHGIGQSREERIYRGVQYSTDVIERVALTIVCRDQFVDPTVKVILEVAHTGDVGDGRIFVSDMIDTWSIRTGGYERNWIITRYCMDAIGSHVGFLDAAGLCAV